VLVCNIGAVSGPLVILVGKAGCITGNTLFLWGKAEAIVKCSLKEHVTGKSGCNLRLSSAQITLSMAGTVHIP
jgi:hypothetical protein